MSDREEINGKTNGSTGHRARRKSARPNQIAYVPINEEDLAPYEPPVKKKYKALKISTLYSFPIFTNILCEYKRNCSL